MNRSMPRISPDRPLGGRYKIISQLGVGGFGRTFLAEDLHLPGHPRCVIKHLKPQSKNDDTLQMARRCFDVEAQVLYHLGNHDQIPRLLAHFEEGQEFYLAQEFIEGEPFSRELADGKLWSQGRTVLIIKDILQVLAFVHQEQVIHRDLKPSNLIRRRHDHRMVLIDFGAVKQVSTPSFDADTGLTNLTISIGTQGYMPNEQLAGKPRFCSDVYAVGVLAIQMLTGIHPRNLGDDSHGEIAWHDHVTDVSPELMAVIDQMVRYDFRDRYIDAATALVALESLPAFIIDVQDYEPIPETIRVGTTSAEASTGRPMTGVTNSTATSLSGQLAKANIEFSHGKDVVDSDEEPVSTALWVPSESLLHSMQAGTGMTRAVGRPHSSNPAVSTEPAAADWARRLTQPWAVAGVLAAGLLFALAQIWLPQLSGTPIVQQPTATNAAGKPIADPTQASSEPEQQAIALAKEAARLLQEKQYDKALNLYDQAIAVKTDFAEAYAGRCETLNHLERPEDALVSCNDALAYKPNYPEALWSQGNVLLLRNRPYDALILYEQVTEGKPEFAPGWVRRGVALQKLGRSAEALVALDKGINLERGSFEAWVTKGEALLNLQRYDAALTALNKALQLQPDDKKALDLRQKARQNQAN
jgi:serine/threonine protein kinase/Flp pilus assembly protein TadD